MKVKTLIKQLQKHDENMNVTFCTASGSESGKVIGVGLDVKTVSIELRTTHEWGEKCEY